MKKAEKKFPPQDPTMVIDKKIKRIRQSREIKDFFWKIILIGAVLFLIFRYIYGIAPVNGEGMYPSLRDGDVGIFFRLDRDFIVKDIVTFKIDRQRYFARIVAVGGDVVDISEDGELIINQNTQQAEIFYPTFILGEQVKFPYTVPEKSVFVLGDQRTNTVDSREFGAVLENRIEGKLISFIRIRGL